MKRDKTRRPSTESAHPMADTDVLPQAPSVADTNETIFFSQVDQSLPEDTSLGVVSAPHSDKICGDDMFHSDTDDFEGAPTSGTAIPPSPPLISPEMYDTMDPTAIAASLDDSSSTSSYTDEEEVQPSQAPVVPKVEDKAVAPTREEWLEEAMRIAIPDLFNWIAAQTQFSVTSIPVELKRPRMALSASAYLPSLDKPEPFVGLSASPGIVNSVQEISQAFAVHRPQSMRSLIGKYAVPGQLFNVNMSTFKLGDKDISMDFLKNPPITWSF